MVLDNNYKVHENILTLFVPHIHQKYTELHASICYIGVKAQAILISLVKCVELNWIHMLLPWI